MKRILPAIVISQFFCTSLWFAGNAIMPDIVVIFQLNQTRLAHLSSSVQIGFISGTLLFALLSIPDRFSPNVVFLCSALLAAATNLVIAVDGVTLNALIACRFLTGLFLAGIYPVGMKIAADNYQQGLGKSLGFLVGALVLGTAFPHLLRSLTTDLPWRYVIYATSLLSISGGLAMYFLVPAVADRKSAQKFSPKDLFTGFRDRDFRNSAIGYFGHMWELYSFWVFVPVILTAYNNFYPATQLNVSLLSFLIIGAGSVACVIGGLLAQRFGTLKTATAALFISFICCIVSPWFVLNVSPTILIIFLFVWSTTVIADSPLFSTLVAQHAPAHSKGTALTIVTCIGFAITIMSIQLLDAVQTLGAGHYSYVLLGIGPAIGFARNISIKKIDHFLPVAASYKA